MRALAANLATKPGFTQSHTVDWAADILYAIASMELLPGRGIGLKYSRAGLRLANLNPQKSRLFSVLRSS